MASTPEHISMALFCDFENVALGVRDANYEKFDIKRVLERLLLKGSIVVKKAYCDWERYKGFKAAMHEANFELIEIPHVRQSGKNSADIRLVVDALDLCYTKSHVNTFVIISGDSDFSPLVSKLRENAKYVIGVGVKQSTSDLLTANCDEFIFYDDLVRESARVDARRNTRNNQPTAKRSPEEEQRRRAELDVRRSKAVEMALETYEALVTDRDEGGKIWASVLKEAIKRRNPGFNENYYGFRTFGNLLEEAKARGLLEFGRDEKSSAFVFRGTGLTALAESLSPEALAEDLSENGYAELPASTESDDDGAARTESAAAPAREAQPESGRHTARDGEPRGRRRGRGRDRDRDRGEAGDGARPSHREPVAPPAEAFDAARVTASAAATNATTEPFETVSVAAPVPAEASEPRRRSRGGRGTTSTRRGKSGEDQGDAAGAVAERQAPVRATPEPAPTVVSPVPAMTDAPPPATAGEPGTPPAAKKARRAPAKKAAPRTRAPRKTSAPTEGA
ncbi:NYN domain-containing protein [Aquabacterium sp.]|uniref:NYN domain-containing protein n=1 Tax=Aquabacterium sp. TaxID=1872578 RepID=UPI0027B887F9|nr:NYN domain-containing protein [Aquabacterium sp.]